VHNQDQDQSKYSLSHLKMKKNKVLDNALKDKETKEIKYILSCTCAQSKRIKSVLGPHVAFLIH